MADALGNLVRFRRMLGNWFDSIGIAPLIDGVAFGAFIADNAFDSNAIAGDFNERGSKTVIS